MNRIAVVYNIDFQEGSNPSSVGRGGLRTFEANSEIEGVARGVAEILNRSGFRAVCEPVSDSLGDLGRRLKEQGTEAVFNLVESLANDASREPELPALLEVLGIPYTGNGATALRQAHAKDTARNLLAAEGIPVPPGFVVHPQGEIPRVRDQGMRYPVFVKPARADASIGVDTRSVVRDRRSLVRRVRWLQKHLGGPVLVEVFLPGREFNVALFPEPRSGVAAVTEIDFSGQPAALPRIVTYNSKWIADSPEAAAVSRPCRDLPGDLLEALTRTARRAFLALGGTGYGRVDLRLDAAGRPAVMDVNPNPSLDRESGFTAAARSAGVAYDDLIHLLACGASLKERHGTASHSTGGPGAAG